jgi:hypothetical protein
VALRLIVNGPVRAALDVNCGVGVFGPGWRANATIGRAVRLVWANVGGARPGVIRMSTFAQPGRYTYCIGEREEESPWEPLHVEHGFAATDGTVAALAAEAPQIVVDARSRSARDVLATIARSGEGIASHTIADLGDTLLVISPARPHHRRRRLVQGRRARVPVGAHAGRGRPRTRGEVPRAERPAHRRRRRYGRPLLGVGARLGLPERALAPGQVIRKIGG